YLELVSCAALLHDVGHGPYSHVFEEITHTRHEETTARIINGQTHINMLLCKKNPGLPGIITGILKGAYSPLFVCNIISSQLDADRMDYIVRDALMCGVKVGFDIQRVINSLTIHEEKLVVEEKGIAAVEAYLLARYYMYWQVYLHKTTRILDMILVNCLKRAQALNKESLLGEYPYKFSFIFEEKEFNLQNYLNVDDVDFIYVIKHWQNHEDKILSDLANRFIKRKLFKKIINFKTKQIKQLKNRVKRHGFDPLYYFIMDNKKNTLYDYYNPRTKRHEEIFVLKNGKNVEFSRCSPIIKKIMGKREETGCYLPAEVRENLLKKQLVQSTVPRLAAAVCGCGFARLFAEPGNII
ncbi:MAG: HD domain-containing protein, partial [bacterium]